MVQRARWARVIVGREVVGELRAPGLVVLLGVTHGDGPVTTEAMARRIWNLRVLEDAEGRMGRSASDLAAPLLVVSQFTLYADTSGGRRPSWGAAAPRDVAEPLVDGFVHSLRALGAEVATGTFGADMLVELGNDGPVTLVREIPPPDGDHPI